MDKYERELEFKIKELKRCQDKQNCKSCIACKEDHIECQLRKEYVKSVYNSMNKGSIGGFEF